MGDQQHTDNLPGAGIEQGITMVPETPSGAAQKTRIASEIDLERFAALPVSERVLTEPLRCVLVETALTGVIRYNWALLRPLVEYLIEKTLRNYENAALLEIGPPRPAFPGEGLADTIARFRSCLGRFSQAPWTVQRLCEVLLAPRDQYSKLHKVALAIEKCLLVTSEVGLTLDPPPPLFVEDLQQQPVNCNPLPVAPRAHSQGGGPVDVHMDSSNAFTHSLLDVYGSPPSVDLPAGPTAAAAGQGQHRAGPAGPYQAAGASAAPAQPQLHQHHHHHHHTPGSHNQGSPGAGITAMEHMEEDHWPEGPLRPGIPLHGLVSHLPHHPHAASHPHAHPGALHPTPPGTAGVLAGHPAGNHVGARGGAAGPAHGEHRQPGLSDGQQADMLISQHTAQEAAAAVAAAAAQAQSGVQGMLNGSPGWSGAAGLPEVPGIAAAVPPPALGSDSVDPLLSSAAAAAMFDVQGGWAAAQAVQAADDPMSVDGDGGGAGSQQAPQPPPPAAAAPIDDSSMTA